MRAWAVDRLPAAEFTVSLLGRAQRVVDVVDGDRRLATAVVVASGEALSGAPVTAALLADTPVDTRAVGRAVDRLVDGLVPTVGRHGALELLAPHGLAARVAEPLAVAVRGRAAVVMRQRLWSCTAAVAPPDGHGRLAPLSSRHHAVVAGWLDDFAVEALGLARRGRHQWMDELDDVEGISLWEDAGVPVSLARARMTTPVSARLGPVYTPPAARGRGYAAALTAGVTARLLDDGTKRVVLLTDLANPTSNRLYPRVGYRPVCPHQSWVVRAGIGSEVVADVRAG